MTSSPRFQYTPGVRGHPPARNTAQMRGMAPLAKSKDVFLAKRLKKCCVHSCILPCVIVSLLIQHWQNRTITCSRSSTRKDRAPRLLVRKRGGRNKGDMHAEAFLVATAPLARIRLRI